MALNVSVIFSTHDRPESLQRSIDSVLAQTQLPYELIIVHDGVKALSPDIAEILRVAGEHFLYRRHRPPSLTGSRNTGIALARGDVLLLLDDDVILPPEYLVQLTRLYEADRQGVVAGIGGLMIDPHQKRLTTRAWNAFAAAFGLCRWAPRRNAGRHLPLPPDLAGRLTPARRLFGGAISIRRSLASTVRFDEALTGYAFGEDLEFSFRVGRNHPLFVCPQLKVRHEVAPDGRPAMTDRGRMYVANFLYILRKTADPGAGTYLLFAYDITGTILRYLIWSALRLHRGNLNFAVGMVQELFHRAALGARKMLCGS